MAEQTFLSPGFFERELVITPQEESQTLGTPAGIIGTADQGPAFIPITVGNFDDFVARFGSVNPRHFGVYAAREFFKNRSAVTYVRVLGGGANQTIGDINKTKTQGTVKNAGFKIEPTDAVAAPSLTPEMGAVQFIVAKHNVSASEAFTQPMFTDNSSTGDGTFGTFETDTVELVRAMIFCASGSRIQILNGEGENWANELDDVAKPAVIKSDGDYKFKLVISASTGGSSFGSTNTVDFGMTPGIRILTCSLDPVKDDYISNILNTDPEKFATEQHLLYAHFPVESELAGLALDSGNETVAVVSGSRETSGDSGDSTQSFLKGFGRFDTRFKTPRTTSFISQPYGKQEYDLFHVETISDGHYGNDKFKISIADLKKSTDPNQPYPTFTLQVRDFKDSDHSPNILEQYTGLDLNPDSANFIAKRIGDIKAYYNFDAPDEAERRIIVNGRYRNMSNRIRVVINDRIYEGQIPASAMPFGFRGIPTLKTNDALSNTLTGLVFDGKKYGAGFAASTEHSRLSAKLSNETTDAWAVSGSILPPLPFRFKCTKGKLTRGELLNDDGNVYLPGEGERADRRLYWGIKFERMPLSSSHFSGEGGIDDAALYPNQLPTSFPYLNPIVENYAKFLGIKELDMMVTGSGADAFHNHKFSLAKVATSVAIDSGENAEDAINAHLTGSTLQHMREAAYIRNAVPRTKDAAVVDNNPSANAHTLVTLGTLANVTSSFFFNKFTNFTKFTNMLYGGFDGMNILDKNSAMYGDRATSMDVGGIAASSAEASPGLKTHMLGKTRNNSAILNYREAAKSICDRYTSTINLLAIPGIREPAVTSAVAETVEDYNLAMYVMDIPHFDEDDNRLFDDRADLATRPDVDKTANQFRNRNVDNSYSAAYFPDVKIEDPINNRRVRVPASVAALSAIGLNDRLAYPWFAPAGFNRAALDFVTSIDVRLTAGDRDELYESRINPISNFPSGGFVIFGQKTLQLASSALDRVNVRRMLLEVKRSITNIANKFVFQQNDNATRNLFVTQMTSSLGIVNLLQGIESFSVLCDDTNNSEQDIANNRLNARIVLVPTRAIEFIAIDFIVDPSGVTFV